MELTVFITDKYSDYWKPLVQFQSSEKFNFDNFHSVLIIFMEEQIFRGPTLLI